MAIAFRAWGSGLWRVLRAPIVVLGVYAFTLAVAAPFGLALQASLERALRAHVIADDAAAAPDIEWWLEYRTRATGLASTFTPTVLGFAAPLENLSALFDASPRPPAVVAAAGAYGVLWLAIWGGVLTRLSRNRALGLRGFGRACRRHLGPLLKIGVVALLAYAILFLAVHAWMFGPLYGRLIASVADERVAFGWRVGLYLAFGLLLALVSVVADYAKVRIVLEDRRGTADALASSLRFLRRHAGKAALLFVLNGSLFLGLLAAYGAGEALAGARLGGWRALAVGQAFILGRLLVRLTFAASELRLVEQVVDLPATQAIATRGA